MATHKAGSKAGNAAPKATGGFEKPKPVVVPDPPTGAKAAAGGETTKSSPTKVSSGSGPGTTTRKKKVTTTSTKSTSRSPSKKTTTEISSVQVDPIDSTVVTSTSSAPTVWDKWGKTILLGSLLALLLLGALAVLYKKLSEPKSMASNSVAGPTASIPTGMIRAQNAPIPEPTEIIEAMPRQHIAANYGGLSLNQAISIIGSNHVNGPLIVNNFGQTNAPSTQCSTNQALQEVTPPPLQYTPPAPSVSYYREPQQQMSAPAPTYYNPPPVVSYYNPGPQYGVPLFGNPQFGGNYGQWGSGSYRSDIRIRVHR